jgi:hypothetical protein
MGKFVNNAMQRSVASQGDTVPQARGNATRNLCYTMGKFVNSAMQRSVALRGNTVTQAAAKCASDF